MFYSCQESDIILYKLKTFSTLLKKRNLNIQYMIRTLLEIENGIKFHCTKPYVILMMAFVQKRTYDFIKQ